MRNVAPNVWLLRGFPPNAINVYLIGDVLIDAGTRWSGRRILRQVGERKLSLLALTHVHPDHQGAARTICEHFSMPLACHQADVATMQGEQPMQPDNRFIRFSTRVWAGSPYPVTQVLSEGDDVGGFRVVETPGHTPGHVILFRDGDRVAVVGDVLNGMNLITTRPGLHEPPSVYTADPAENRRSIRKLAELQPRTILFGHGPPLTDMAKFDRFLENLKN